VAFVGAGSCRRGGGEPPGARRKGSHRGARASFGEERRGHGFLLGGGWAGEKGRGRCKGREGIRIRDVPGRGKAQGVPRGANVFLVFGLRSTGGTGGEGGGRSGEDVGPSWGGNRVGGGPFAWAPGVRSPGRGDPEVFADGTNLDAPSFETAVGGEKPWGLRF